MILFSQSNGVIFCFYYKYEQNQKEIALVPIRSQQSVKLTEDLFFISNYSIKEDKNNIKYLNNEVL